MENINSRTNFQIGPFLSLFDSQGNLKLSVDEPSFNIYTDVPKQLKINSRILTFKYENSDPKFFLHSMWIHVPLPRQSTESPTKKIFYTNHFSGIDIVKNIKIYFNTQLRKELKRQDYEFQLKSLKNYQQIYDKYLNLKGNINYLNRLENKTNEEIDADVIHLIIFFNPKSYELKNYNVDIEVHFDIITKLYAITKGVKLNDLDFDKIEATAVSFVVNDYDYFQKNENPLYEKELTYDYYNLGIKNEITISNDNLARSAIFLINDQSFRSGEFFYGKTIKESVYCYLNSCFKAENDSDTCLDLKLCQFTNTNLRTLYTAEKLDSNRIQLTYKNNEVEYKTCIQSKKIKFSDLEGLYFDHSISDILNIFWFEFIDIDICEFDSVHHKLDNTKTLKNSTRIIDGLFTLPTSSKKFSIIGVCDFKLSNRIKIPNDISGLSENENKFFNQQHFDVYFSLPVFNKKHSYFSEFDFICLDYSDWRWMDLDRKYEWKISKIIITDTFDTNFNLQYNTNKLKIGSISDFEYIKINFVNSNNGYISLNNFKFKLENTDEEFYKIKKQYINKIVRKIYISKQNFFNKHNFKQLDLINLKKLSTHETCQMILENEGYKRSDFEFI